MKTKTILIVDDEQNLLDVIAEGLIEALPDSEIIKALGVEQAKAAATATPIDIVVCDYYMQDGTWREVIADIKRANPKAAFAICSGSIFEKGLLINLVDGGVDCTFLKPVNYVALAEFIQDALSDKINVAA